MRKRTKIKSLEIIAIAASIVLAQSALTGCGSNASSKTDNTSVEAEDSESSADISDADVATSDADNAIAEDEAEASKESGEEAASDTITSQPISDFEIDALNDVLITKMGVKYEDIKYTAFDDFDGDGSFEGFAYVGLDVDDMNWCDGTVYYVTMDKCDKIFTGSLYYDKNVFNVVDAGNRRFIIFEEAYVTSLVSYVYYIDNGDPVESKVSRIGDIYVGNGLKNVSILLSAYDAYCSLTDDEEYPEQWSGHTWKPYYFYYDSTSKDFEEYGATTISEAELKDIIGFDLVGEIEADGSHVISIIKRDNGIINVNYSTSTTYEDGSEEITYSNANYDENKGAFLDTGVNASNDWKSSDFGGTYDEGLLP